MKGTEHLDVQLLYDLLDGRLDPAAESAAQAHLLRCERCRGLERECGGVVESLRWYGLETAEPPLQHTVLLLDIRPRYGLPIRHR